LIEPVSKNIDMYVPAFPLPIMEVGSFIKSNLPEKQIEIISIPVDYGLPLTPTGREEIYCKLLEDISELRPKGIGLSCTAIAQAEEVIRLCDRIKAGFPEVFIFLGGYFPSIYYEEIFFITSSVDMVVVGEGELPTLQIVQFLEKGISPIGKEIPGVVWKQNGTIYTNSKGDRFDLKQKALIQLELLRYPKAYDILPYAFSRGCPYRCNFCMEEFIRPQRREVPEEIIRQDLIQLSQKGNCRSLLFGDALFQSFNHFPFIRSLGMKIHFETRCDVLDPALIAKYPDIFGIIALGLESASYDTLRRMNKVRNKHHFQKYLDNASAIFQMAVAYDIPIMIFMIAGYPGDIEKDLEESLHFVENLSRYKGQGGAIFKIGECRIYPKTKLHAQTPFMPGLIFDNDGVFGQNIVRQPSPNLSFETILDYVQKIFNLSHLTPKLQETIMHMMPFFRLPSEALLDPLIPEQCYQDSQKDIFNVSRSSLEAFKNVLPALAGKYQKGMADQRSRRNLQW
jgi:pyruvate-formate lyase-activating enzyme